MTGMKIGTETGSFTNYVLSHQDKGAGDLVKVGDGATVLAWSDRYAATVIGVRGDKRKIFTIRWDRAIRTDQRGMSEWQEYRFEDYPEGRVEEVTFRKGSWRIKGSEHSVRFGKREAYHDYSF